MKKISIITVCFNSSVTLKETIDSVLSQDYPNIEYIIVDGASTDKTQSIIESYGPKIDVFISEKDNGLYDAMNKGIKLATGDIIGILNSDDIYENNHILRFVSDAFSQNNADCVFGDLIYFKSDQPNKIVRRFTGARFNRQKVRIGILPPHPTFFARKKVYEQYGTFDTQFKYASDFDLMTRFLYVHQVPHYYLPMVMVRMRLGGISTGSFKRIIEINKEDLISCRKNQVPTNFFLFHLKYLIKIFHLRSISGIINR